MYKQDNSITDKVNEVEAEILKYIKGIKGFIEQGNYQIAPSLSKQKGPTPIDKDSTKERCGINTREKGAQAELVEETKAFLRNTERLQRVKSFSATKKVDAGKEDLRTLKREVEALKSEAATLEAETEEIETSKLPAMERSIAKQAKENRQNQDSLDAYTRQENKLNEKKKALNEVNGRLSDLGGTFKDLKEKIVKMQSEIDQIQ